MKVTDWYKNLRFALMAAAGLSLPSAVYAQSIPLLDPSFEAYVVPANPGYAYAAHNQSGQLGAYRPVSAWVDDLDSPTGYTQDNVVSNWLYDSAYAEGTAITRRPAPRTGNQAMHGLFNYSAQETAAVFEAGKSYRFSIWAQNDVLLNETNGVFLNIFDGTVAFSDDNALASQLFTAINARGINMTQAQSAANWTQITVKHGVLPGSPEVGHPIGVGFYARKDSAVDDATLTAVPIEDDFMYLEVNTTTGQTTIKNSTGTAVNIDYYEVTSAGSSLNTAGWNSLQDQNLAGFPTGNGTGNGWEQAGASNAKVLSESFLTGNSSVGGAASISLGTAFKTGFAQDLKFNYGALTGPATAVNGDYNGNNVVDAADYTVWRNNLGGSATLPNDSTPGTVIPADYDVWKANFGQTGGVTGTSSLITGFVKYVTSGGAGATAIPEPTSVLLVGMGLSMAAGCGRRKRQ